MDFEVPDRIGAVEGWRAWFLVSPRNDPGARLMSIIYPAFWEPGEETVARCRKSAIYRHNPVDHEAPDEDCICGVYALFDQGRVRRKYGEDLGVRPASRFQLLYRVIGRVALWGKVVEGGDGARASRAYPLEFQVPRRIKGLDTLSPREVEDALGPWGVPVTVLEETWAD